MLNIRTALIFMFQCCSLFHCRAALRSLHRFHGSWPLSRHRHPTRPRLSPPMSICYIRLHHTVRVFLTSEFVQSSSIFLCHSVSSDTAAVFQQERRYCTKSSGSGAAAVLCTPLCVGVAGARTPQKFKLVLSDTREE